MGKIIITTPLLPVGHNVHHQPASTRRATRVDDIYCLPEKAFVLNVKDGHIISWPSPVDVAL